MVTDRLIPYGDPIEARDIAEYRGRNQALWLTQLSRLVLQAELAVQGLTHIVPEATDRITVADGGVDFQVTLRIADIPVGRPAGWVNPGRTVYQVKWRTDTSRARYAATGELATLRDGDGLPDAYVFITNADLTQDDRNVIVERLQEGCPFPLDRIVTVGAADLATRVTLDPRIRIAYFRGAALSLCTWEQAIEAAERGYGNTTPPPFYDREEERNSIRRFMADPVARVLILYGPEAVGKTRLALEALSPTRDQVVWARDVPLQAPALLQILDDAPQPSVLVIDVPDAEVDTLVARAGEMRHVKTMVITGDPIRAPRASVVVLRPFHQPATMDFMKRALPQVPHSHAHWLYTQFAGFPGLLVEGAAALASLEDHDPLEHQDIGAILDRYERRAVTIVGRAADSLTVLSLLPRITWAPDMRSPDADVLCDTLRVDWAQLRQDLELLIARGLVEPVGFHGHREYRVIPPLLARRRARGAILALADQFPEVFGRLSAEGRAGLVRRAGEPARDPALREVMRWLWATSGVFADLNGLAEHALCVTALADTVPERTAEAVRAVLDRAEIDARRALEGDARRTLVRALDNLLRHPDTFEAAARSLLLLAEAENERYANNATHVFEEAFRWDHPEIPRDGRLQTEFLRRLAGEATPAQRVIIARAAGEVLNVFPSISLSQAASLRLPQLGWRPTTWGQVHEVLRTTMALLRRLATDSDESVRTAGQIELARGVLASVRAGIPDDGVEALEFLADTDRTPAVMSVVAESTAGLLAEVQAQFDQQGATGVVDPWRGVAARAAAVFDRLTAGNFRARFHHWLGPAPMRPHRRLTGVGGWEEVRQAAEQLAIDVIAQPDLLTDDLLEWAIGDEAAYAGLFLRHLGVVDRERRWLPPLEARIEHMRVGAALATYIHGWALSDPDGAGAYLDRLAERPGNGSYAVVNSVWALGPTDCNVDRLLRCVTLGRVPRHYVAQQLGHGGWPEGLPLAAFLRLLGGLRAGTPEVDWAFTEVLEAAWPQRRDEWDQLGPLAFDILRNCAGTESRWQEGHHWDGLAAALADWDPEIGFRLLLIHREDPVGRAYVSLRFDRHQLLEVLSRLDRSRVVRELIAAAAAGDAQSLGVRLDLPYLLRPETDIDTLQQLAEKDGVETARLISENLDAALPGFRECFVTLAVRWGDDADVRRGLAGSAATVRSSEIAIHAEELEKRASYLEELSRHANPRVTDVAREARRTVLEALEQSKRGWA